MGERVPFISVQRKCLNVRQKSISSMSVLQSNFYPEGKMNTLLFKMICRISVTPENFKILLSWTIYYESHKGMLRVYYKAK